MKQKMMSDGRMAIEVTPMGHRKSFYGKAWEIGKRYGWELVSYGTTVARLDRGSAEECLKLVRLWDGYSATTMRHINAWLQWHGMNLITKKQWEEMEVEK